MRIASLGSGSKGNGTLVEHADTCLLIDLGFSIKEATRRLGRLGKTPHEIDAILVTHEHADHIHGVAPFARKFSTPVYMTPGTRNEKKQGLIPSLNRVNSHRSFTIGCIEVEPVPVPHDAKEPCQYVFASGGVRVGVLTDLGHITTHVEHQYRSCDALLLECNHDPAMLADGPYPYHLKQRVGGNHGHLSNEQAAGLLGKIELDRLQHLVISHISEKNNQPELACDALAPYLAQWQGCQHVADQLLGFPWLEINPCHNY